MLAAWVAAALCGGSCRSTARPAPSPRRAVAAWEQSGRRVGGAEFTCPLAGTIFPPELPAPLLEWRCADARAEHWAVCVTLGGEAQPWIGPAEATRWRPDERLWRKMKAAGACGEVEVAVVGCEPSPDGRPRVVASAAVRFTVSADPVGAPILYRSVPLPFLYAVQNPDTIRWHLLDVGAAAATPPVLQGLPVCGNCHSFDAAGRTLGMDVDYANDKGSYAIVDLAAETVLSPRDIITWSDFGRGDGRATFGLLSRLSPDGRWVLSTVKDRSVFVPRPGLAYSQLFFPIRGVLGWYDRQTRRFGALGGADDPNFVQSNASWSPDGRWVYFCRAKAADLHETPDQRDEVITPHLAAQFIDGKRPFRFDIWRVPFNGGAGGHAEPINGASSNGKSNYFPRVSPDGKWLAFCQAANFMLLQPDSELYIMPLDADTHDADATPVSRVPRRMTCNTGRMNSWHCWSPNGRWLVFATKLRGPYTQLCLTHVDAAGRDSPPVLLERAMETGRACNIPEFLNAPPSTRLVIREAFLDYHNYRRQGQVLLLTGKPAAAVELFGKALAKNPADAASRLRLAAALSSLGRRDEADRQFAELFERLAAAKADGATLYEAHCHAAEHFRSTGRADEAAEHYRRALACRPSDVEVRLLLGLLLASRSRLAEAEKSLREAVAIQGDSALAQLWLGQVLRQQGKDAEGLAHLRAALHASPRQRDDWLLIARRVLPVGELAGELEAFLGRYLQRFPRCPQGHVLLSRLCEAGGRRREAVEHLEQARRADPNIPWLAERIEQLKAAP